MTGIPELLDNGYKVAFIVTTMGGVVVFLKGGLGWLIEFKAKLDFIESQLKTNGGSSLRDAINTLNHEVAALKKDMAMVKAETTDVQTPILKEVKTALSGKE